MRILGGGTTQVKGPYLCQTILSTALTAMCIFGGQQPDLNRFSESLPGSPKSFFWKKKPVNHGESPGVL